MSIETDATDVDAGDDELDALARELGERIEGMPLYERYQEAKAEVEADEDLQEQIREFEQIREEFMLARQTGEATREELRTLQDAQEELHDHPAMSEYLQAQNELELRLQELNEIISEPLTVDFGGKAGGCCED
ncbi:MAG: YlbF family regulator [Halosimplex sp.]